MNPTASFQSPHPDLEGRAPRVRPLSGDAGFTLFELLLAVAIFAVVLIAIQSVFHSALSLRNRTVAQIESAVPLQHALEILRRDLANLVPPGGTFSGPLQSAFLTGGGLGQASTPATNAYRASLPGMVVSPELYTATGIIDDQRPWGEIARVTYYLADPTNNTLGRDLVRSVVHNLLPVVEEDPEQQWLLGGVDNVLFLFFDGFDWVDDWDSTTAATPLPSAFKIQLWLTPDNGSRTPSDPIELVVPILVEASTNETDTASGGGV
jgi:prepilin-type N-terminal cleavage/methylation domain-containing protein